MSALRQFQQEKFEYTKGVIRIRRKSKDVQHTVKQEKGQNYLQNNTKKTNDRAQLKTGVKSGDPEYYIYIRTKGFLVIHLNETNIKKCW